MDGEEVCTGTDPELLALCSGKFESQAISDTNGSSSEQRRGGIERGMIPNGISKLLRSTSLVSGNTEDRSTLESTDEILGLCSGAFPRTQTQHEGNISERKTHFTKFGVNVQVRGKNDPPLDYSSSSDSEGEGDDGVLSFAQRQRRLTSMLSLGGGNEGDDLMPKLTRKRKRGRPMPKATKE